ncbi:MAG: DUF6599 family protein [Pyrinomonadaceae bacterium]
MRFWLSILVFGLLVIVGDSSIAKADETFIETDKLPERISVFRARGPISIPPQPPSEAEQLSSTFLRIYVAPSGKSYRVNISKTRSASEAYALLSSSRGPNEEIKTGTDGTVSIAGRRTIVFRKGPYLVRVLSEDVTNPLESELGELANAFAQHLEGESSFPVLVKHLPAWESVGPSASYAVTQSRLKELLPGQSIVDVVSFEGGAEAVVAQYDEGKLAIVEFNTPQIATTNDHDIVARINELKASVPPSGTPLPPTYRRVGNYAVFVFDAPSAEAANQLIDQVKYQQVVQWLGENPFSYEQATREFTETTLGVLVSVVQTSGLALVGCLAVGGLFGALLFRSRRAQQRAREAYADSDAMIRLNLDEMTPEKRQ